MHQAGATVCTKRRPPTAWGHRASHQESNQEELLSARVQTIEPRLGKMQDSGYRIDDCDPADRLSVRWQHPS
jgi:hypothetical protein